MHRVTTLAIFSPRRQEKITHIKWADLDEDGKHILVRDMKNPGEKPATTCGATFLIQRL